jgi:hypothetical protein
MIMLVLLPVLLVSCEKEEKVPVSVQVISVQATRLAPLKNGTQPWDAPPNDPEPDPFFRIRLDNSQDAWIMSMPIMRNRGTAPFTFSGSSFNLPFPQEIYAIEVWDDDSIDIGEGGHDFIGGYTFRPWVPGNGHPTTITLDRPNVGIALQLTLSYQF